MLELNKSNFNEEIKKGKIIVKYTALWCNPCKAMSPIFEELSKEMKNIAFATVDVDQNQEVAAKFRVMSIPTFIIFKDGKEAGRIMGGMSKDALKSKIEAAL